MKTHSFLFLCLFLNQFMSIKSAGYYKYLNGRNYRSRSDCFCGFNKEHFSDAFGDKYCCLHQDSCQIDGPPYEKWCPNATLMSMNHRCNSFCFDNSMNAQWSKVLIHGRNIYFGYVWEKQLKIFYQSEIGLKTDRNFST